MIEISTLSGKSNTRKVKYERIDDIIKVKWGRSEFKITDELYEEILEKFFKEENEWYPLGSCCDNPTKGGLGEFIENLRSFNLNPKHASAIAAIMHDEGFIDYRIIGHGIELCKEA